ncbi:MAG: ABC transporter permease subunit [Candidatus Thermoplasmatota archaeon]|nr:ABC transporter permease subunit [Candidatus Thermoplasmatota archaeon]MBU4072060.1 ABC transporter permease subunit [Candidatus Thermoplasmatota archaeon]MBU4144612.1 ABC transporter permease subunit [Candidatus Thermoplasmatota archaeon]MBU4592372.1 ABC transporter permease subunit [Candidatus Thermoplasmatota archaeon]
MVSSKQIKEKIRDYRRSIKHSWLLFKDSRIGMVGLGIMIFFIVMALTSPYLGLRHPMDWWAPDDDILEITPYFNGDEGVRTTGPFMQGVTYRMRPAPGTAQYADRLYAAGGKGNLIDPYGLYAYDPDDGRGVWNFVTGSEINTPVNVNNYGSGTNAGEADLRLIFGCDNGRLYVLRDGFVENWANFAPSGEREWYHPLNGSVVGVDYHDYRGYPVGLGARQDLKDNPFNQYDLIFASTTNGYLYAFEGPTPQWNPVTNSWNVTRPILLWERQVSNVSLTAPAVSDNGEYVYVGTNDGLLYGIDVASGLDIPEWNDAVYRVTDGYWSTSPVTVGNPPVVYATTGDGFVHCIIGLNGTAKELWSHIDIDSRETKNGYQLKDRGDIDGGNLTDIDILPDGSQIIIGSSTGYVYSVNTQSVNESIAFDTRIGLQDTVINVVPYYDWQFTQYLFVTAINLNDTATDPSDDFTILYCMASAANSSVKWRKTVDGVVMGHPASYLYNPHLSKADVVFATVFFEPDGTPTAGRMYSYNAAGTVITPLPPTWVTSEGAEESKYQPPPSGNYYWLGTDSQGHDILSQTVLGSRIALLVGFMSAFFSISIGVIFGLVSGYYGKGIDAILMRFTDVILVLPALPLLIIFAAIMNPSIWNIILIISLVGWGGVARVIRAEVLSLKERPFIDSARVTGASKSRIMFKHIAPNVLPLGLLYMTFAVSGAILFEAALSFIGLGDPSTMTWGMMLNYVQHSNALTNWWWLLPPGICITLVCMAFFLLGRAFDEIVNPRLRRRR